MQTVTRRPSYLELAAQIEAEERDTWPEGAIECTTCRGFRQITIGFIDGTPQHRDCPSCHFGYILPAHDEPLRPAPGMSGSCLSVREPERRTTGSRSEGLALTESAGAAM